MFDLFLEQEVLSCLRYDVIIIYRENGRLFDKEFSFTDIIANIYLMLIKTPGKHAFVNLYRFKLSLALEAHPLLSDSDSSDLFDSSTVMRNF